MVQFLNSWGKEVIKFKTMPYIRTLKSVMSCKKISTISHQPTVWFTQPIKGTLWWQHTYAVCMSVKIGKKKKKKKETDTINSRAVHWRQIAYNHTKQYTFDQRRRNKIVIPVVHEAVITSG